MVGVSDAWMVYLMLKWHSHVTQHLISFLSGILEKKRCRRWMHLSSATLTLTIAAWTGYPKSIKQWKNAYIIIFLTSNLFVCIIYLYLWAKVLLMDLVLALHLTQHFTQYNLLIQEKWRTDLNTTGIKLEMSFIEMSKMKNMVITKTINTWK